MQSFPRYQKAFHTVNHEVLLTALQCYGMRGQELPSYLPERIQCFNVNGKTFHYRLMIGGVSQGSFLGSWLFILYMNDLSAFISTAKTESTCR